MDRSEVRERLRAFVLKDMIRMPTYDLQDDEPLITGGLVDSFSLALFGVFVQEQFGVFIPDPDLTVDNLDTLTQMVDRVMRDLA
ncbi:MAG: acyl carrier protein [Aggregatilineaceae bacterium]